MRNAAAKARLLQETRREIFARPQNGVFVRSVKRRACAKPILEDELALAHASIVAPAPQATHLGESRVRPENRDGDANFFREVGKPLCVAITELTGNERIVSCKAQSQSRDSGVTLRPLHDAAGRDGAHRGARNCGVTAV